MEEQNFSQVMTAAISKFVSAQLYALESGNHPDMLTTFADFTFNTYKALQRSTLAKNPFIKQETLFAFSREALHFCYSIADDTINLILRDQISADISRSKSARPPRPEEASPSELQQWVDEVGRISREEYTHIQKSTENAVIQLHSIYFSRFNELYEACESPLEQALLIGLLAHHSGNGWELLDPTKKTLEAQYNIGPYRADFAIPHNKVAIELDGHTYHERTAEQAAHDRFRDRELQEQGWKVFRFHTSEIEAELEKCVAQVLRKT